MLKQYFLFVSALVFIAGFVGCSNSYPRTPTITSAPPVKTAQPTMLTSAPAATPVQTTKASSSNPSTPQWTNFGKYACMPITFSRSSNNDGWDNAEIQLLVCLSDDNSVCAGEPIAGPVIPSDNINFGNVLMNSFSLVDADGIAFNIAWGSTGITPLILSNPFSGGLLIQGSGKIIYLNAKIPTNSVNPSLIINEFNMVNRKVGAAPLKNKYDLNSVTKIKPKGAFGVNSDIYPNSLTNVIVTIKKQITKGGLQLEWNFSGDINNKSETNTINLGSYRVYAYDTSSIYLGNLQSDIQGSSIAPLYTKSVVLKAHGIISDTSEVKKWAVLSYGLRAATGEYYYLASGEIK
jgi:hypothetical protein